MATSNPVLRYLASWKNLAGCAGGLIGLVLHFAGLAGSYWILVVIGLYGVGALAAPPERIILVTDPEEKAGQLRAELDALVHRVRGFGGRVPAEVAPKLAEIAEVLRGMPARPPARASSAPIRTPCTPSPGSWAPTCRCRSRPT
ncbi:hypothetical protein C8D88_103566 [Lentzea atacamensis]|uniref:Uncharacterized protein n=1 Tax=Lentzea atacamensis TaxID=531938 RepID=A0A316I7J7_9PSEU|nr:hypothetical protein [Lentzea atacamensis]PWK88370.1 hypothetical protein C8D88_103566 [Lentzea atacamensis]